MDLPSADLLASASRVAGGAVPRLFARGVALSPPAPSLAGTLQHAPFALLPSAVPARAYTTAIALAPAFNALVDAVARDGAWLRSTLAETAAGDAFTARLLALLEDTPRQPLVLGVHRSDYMVDRGPDGLSAPRLAQVEINTISASFASLSTQLGAVHAALLERYAGEPSVVAHLAAGAAAAAGIAAAARRGSAADAPAAVLPPSLTGLACLPRNEALAGIAAALAQAHAVYCERHGVGERGRAPIVAMVVQPAERNVMDQRLLEAALWDAHGVACRRTTLAELSARGRTRDADGALLLPAEQEGAEADIVAVAYFRCGYTPEDYAEEEEACWAGRALVERSLAVKCPSVGYHLAGAKKVQQALAMAGGVERFLPAGEAASLRTVFAGLWSLGAADVQGADAGVYLQGAGAGGSSAGVQQGAGAGPLLAGPQHSASAFRDACAHPERYVMKPQREGGGNNLYGAAIARALGPGGLSPVERSAHILMERLFPAPAPVWFVRPGAAPHVQLLPAVSELGVYGVFLGDGGERAPLLNRAVGHLLRSKVDGTDEGGVAAGFAVLDSPMLV